MSRPLLCLVTSLGVALALLGCSSNRSADRTDGGTSTPSASAVQVSPGIKRIASGHMPCATLGAVGAVWVANLGDNAVRRIAPTTLRVGPPIRTGLQPCGLAYGAGSIWVEDYGDNTVTRIDPTT